MERKLNFDEETVHPSDSNQASGDGVDVAKEAEPIATAFVTEGSIDGINDVVADREAQLGLFVSKASMPSSPRRRV